MKEIKVNSRAVMRVTAIGLLWNIVLCVFKVAAGVVGQSQAVLADGVHSLSDIGTDLAVILGAKFWGEPADSEHPYGHGRLESIISLAIALILAAVGTGLVGSSLFTLRSGQPATTPGWVAAIAAATSLLVKESLYRWTRYRGRDCNSAALQANAWHHRSDALSSIPALAAVVGAKLYPEWWLLDPIGGVVVSLLILHAAWTIGAGAVQSLIDRGAPADDVRKIRELAMHINGVEQVHAIRTRSLGQGWSVDLHVLVDAGMTVRKGHNIAEQVHQLLLEHGPHVADSVIHIEPADHEVEEPAL